ncbi:MAG: LuxR C-terminal-related transcriptional regulator [Actinomycetota bacterium]|nr:LuxR C-terminal-related transcriptional regulator [Actinomycetota bacterium]
MTGTVGEGREAFRRQAWAEAYALLDHASDWELDPEDIERLAIAAYLVGRDDESAQAWERAHLACLRLDNPGRAAQCGFWLGLALLFRGETARASGWFGRVGRLVEDGELDCAARGYLLVPAALQACNSGDAAGAYTLFTEAGKIAARFGDKDLAAFACLGQGQASIASGEAARGVALLDEVMVSVTTGEVSPIPVGIVYCAVIETCMGVFDLRRAAEWTEALSDWCQAQPDLVPYRGQCLVYRSQILQVHGEWPQAAMEARRACERLSQPAHPALGLAVYQRAELHRLGGEFDEAEEAYRQASQCGREPVPGWALLRLVQGHLTAAAAAIRRAVDESHDALERPTVLAAYVEIMVAVGDLSAARIATDELLGIAGVIDAPFLHAIAAHAAGLTLLAESDASAALAALRRASAGWRELEMPYEAARTRVQIGLACRALGDQDMAALELDAARGAFVRLGARPDLAWVAELASGPRQAGPLTLRECEVLRLVAAGKTNREIGTQLVLSEHTVARHLQNIFAKLGLSSRAATTAYAYQHGVV